MSPTPQMPIQNEPPNLFYRGSSMKGTFKAGDRLSIEKVPFQKIRKGDLIIFRKTINDKTEFVVHRVRHITPNGAITRGDNSLYNDRILLMESDIIGRVSSFDRNGKMFSTRNGFLGRMRAFRLHTRLRLNSILKRSLRTPYRWLKKSGIVSRIWYPKIEIVQCQTPQGPLFKFIHRNRTIATYWTKQNKWICRRPYDLVLPTPTKR